MTYFSFSEFIFTAVSASIYGLVFEIFMVLIGFAPRFLSLVWSVASDTFIYSGKLRAVTPPKSREVRSGAVGRTVGFVITFLKTVVFCLGLFIVSYSALDGVVRVYAYACGIFGLIFARLILGAADKIKLPFKLLYKFLVVCLRVVTLPLRPLVSMLCRILPFITERIISISPRRAAYYLDKNKK